MDIDVDVHLICCMAIVIEFVAAYGACTWR